MNGNTIGAKMYLIPEGMVFEAITDLAGIQGAKVTLSDSSLGKISFFADLYGVMREYCFSITNIGKKRCNVCLTVVDPEIDKQGKKVMIRRQFALLDSMLVINADTAFDGQGAGDLFTRGSEKTRELVEL